MCGIAGYVGSSAKSTQRITAVLNTMKRRGPDSCNHKSWDNLYFLHTRLSIIDLDPRAHQPFYAKGHWMIYNGELYNYRELRLSLESEGVTFATQSDTEVLLHVLIQWGWKGLDRCEGMWAFAVYDESDKSITLCRDRFGEKPLYYLENAEGFYFASEVKSIQAFYNQPLHINHDHLYRYLINGYKSLYKKPLSFFKDIAEVPPGTTLRIEATGRKTETRYWTPTFNQNATMSFEEAVQGTRERLFQSMNIRLRADVPLAFCMSGGVDSNALISIAKRIFGYDVHGFTISNTDSRYEEQDLVDQSVQELKIRHTLVKLETTDFLMKLRTLILQHDAPVYTITYFTHWLLMERMAREGYRIAVSGTAADELFSGYYDHHLAYLYEIRNDSALHAQSKASWMRYIQPIVRNPYLKDPDLFIKNPRERRHIYLNSEEFESFMTKPWHEAFTETPFTEDLLRNRMLNEIFHEATPVILHEDDLNAMYFSIENRSPFLDRHLFEFSQTIPTRHLMRDAYTKVILRESVRDIVPWSVLENRRKVGFNAPLFSLLDVANSDTRNYLLADSPIFEHVKRDAISELLKREALPNSESKFLFNFINAKIFLEEFGR